MEKMDQPRANCNPTPMDHTLHDLKTYVERAAQAGTAAHEAEAAIWSRVLPLGKQALELLFALVGPGDVGDSVVLPDGAEVRRLAAPHPRVYQSVFGRFELERVVYGSRARQKIEYIPFDTQLQLPASDFSYLLQDWSQSLAVEQVYRRVPETLDRILAIKPAVDSLERMNRQLAETVRPFRDARPAPAPKEEGALCVVSADGKGIPLRRPAPEVPIHAHDRAQAPKTNGKKMAVVGAVYTIDPLVRSPEEVVASLFRDPADTPPPTARPKPQHKRLWSHMASVFPPQES